MKSMTKNYLPLSNHSSISTIIFREMNTKPRLFWTIQISSILPWNKPLHATSCIGYSLFLATFNYIIIPKPGKLNKANALSRHPDYKEGIASKNAEQVLLMPEKFHIQALYNIAIPTGMDLDLKAALKEGIEVDRVTRDKLKTILTGSPRHITKGLQDWNYEDGLFLYKGLVYIPNNENLRTHLKTLPPSCQIFPQTTGLCHSLPLPLKPSITFSEV